MRFRYSFLMKVLSFTARVWGDPNTYRDFPEVAPLAWCMLPLRLLVSGVILSIEWELLTSNRCSSFSNISLSRSGLIRRKSFAASSSILASSSEKSSLFLDLVAYCLSGLMGPCGESASSDTGESRVLVFRHKVGAILWYRSLHDCQVCLEFCPCLAKFLKQHDNRNPHVTQAPCKVHYHSQLPLCALTFAPKRRVSCRLLQWSWYAYLSEGS